jgi:phospholipid/cholesterol/gamma-HCH transport system permease protein
LAMLNILQSVGRSAINYVDVAGRMFLFWTDVMIKCLTPRFYFSETARQVYSIGVTSLLLTCTVAISVGLVLAMQTIGTLQIFGATNYVSVVVGQAVVKEIGPVLTALMVAGRAGAGISAEIGSMRVTRQIDAITVSAVNPVRYLVVTRVLACMIAVPLLTVTADILGIFGGMIIGVQQANISLPLYISYTIKYIGLNEVIPGLLKTIFFGMLVGTVSCYYGFQTTGGTEGVGNATKASVVTASLLIMIFDVIITRLLLWVFEPGLF